MSTEHRHRGNEINGHKNWKRVFDLNWLHRRNASREHNKQIFTGRRATNSGLTWFENGQARVNRPKFKHRR